MFSCDAIMLEYGWGEGERVEGEAGYYFCTQFHSTKQDGQDADG